MDPACNTGALRAIRIDAGDEILRGSCVFLVSFFGEAGEKVYGVGMERDFGREK